MSDPRPSTTRGGRAWLDALLAGILVLLVSLLALPAIQASRQKSALEPVAQEAHALYAAFQHYRERNGAFPDVRGNPAFDLNTFEPLRRRGYYDGKLNSYLLGEHVDAYDAPDDQGPNHEFWLEMTLVSDPEIHILIATSDDAPLGRGKSLDGVFVVRGGLAEPL